MFKFRNDVLRLRWWSTCECFNRRMSVAPPFPRARALKIRRPDDRVVLSSSHKSRFLSSLVAEEEDAKPFSIISEDRKDIYSETTAMLRNKITHTEMYDIATYYYHILGDTTGFSSLVSILLSKALNYHLFNDGALRDSQRKVIAIAELLVLQNVLHDDIIDNANSRMGFPTAHKLWPTYKVVVTGNMIVGVGFSEASTLSNDVNAVLFQLHEVLQKGQFMSFRHVTDSGDLFGNYLTGCDYKNASPIKYASIATARAVRSKYSLEDIMSRLGFNFGMLYGVVDDIVDFEDDVKNGHVSAPVLYAMREYPELEEIVLRRFAEDGDVEKTIELVNASSGFEETRTLARMYYKLTMNYLYLLADSPYKTAFETLAKLLLRKSEPGAVVKLKVEV